MRRYYFSCLIFCGALVSCRQQLSNLHGGRLELCSEEPVTGWFRDGYCKTDENDFGEHTVCAEMSQEFLDFTRARGNDLSTPRGTFPGLKPGDRWCLCASRWKQALEAGVAPAIVAEATNLEAGPVAGVENLISHALGRPARPGQSCEVQRNNHTRREML